jgi:hypothetical protein
MKKGNRKRKEKKRKEKKRGKGIMSIHPLIHVTGRRSCFVKRFFKTISAPLDNPLHQHNHSRICHNHNHSYAKWTLRIASPSHPHQLHKLYMLMTQIDFYS